MLRRSIAATLVLLAPLALRSPVFAADAHSGHGTNAQGMTSRGDSRMGFDHAKTTHHFRLRPDGGVIEVTANSEKDAGSTGAIRMHLAHIARMFADGDFSAPMFIHDQTPPGVPAMQRLQKEIAYRFEEMPRGGRVVITAPNPEAVRAVHDFLRFQIEEHRTGDPVEPAPR